MKKFKIAGLIMIVGFLLVFAGTANAEPFTWAQDISWSSNGSTVSDARSFTDNALGAPDKAPVNNDGINFLSLGIGGFAVFDFGTEFDQASVIFETTYGSTANYVEAVTVYAFDASYSWGDNPGDFTGWTEIGDYTNTSAKIEFNVDGPFRYLALLDVTQEYAPNNSNSYNGDGFDVNAVGVNPVPEPGTIVLMGAGLIGLVGLRRKFRR